MRITTKKSQSARPGFTLVEIVVVVAIIAILAALTTAAVFRALDMGIALQNQNDMTQLANALQAFKAKYNEYPPSQVLLSNNYADYQSNPLGPRSLKYLNRFWTKLSWGSLDWSGGLGMPSGGVVLQGDQCLVFFLGGIPSANGPMGFSPSPKNPTLVSGVAEPVKFFDFKINRLYKRGTGPFFSYLDAYSSDATGRPFVYFSSGFRENGYQNETVTFGGGDSVSPYAISLTPRRFYNPKTFQLISAGPDNLFGLGGIYDTANPNVLPQAEDDMSNFHAGDIGTGE